MLIKAFHSQNVHLRPGKWRYGRPGLRLHWYLGWLFTGYHLNGRDGFDVRTRSFSSSPIKISTNVCFLRAPTAGGQYHWVSEVSSFHPSVPMCTDQKKVCPQRFSKVPQLPYRYGFISKLKCNPNLNVAQVGFASLVGKVVQHLAAFSPGLRSKA